MRPTATAARRESREKSGTALSREIGQRYNVSSKTVRDIWGRVTWTDATHDMWSSQELQTPKSQDPGDSFKVRNFWEVLNRS
mmetsp:Transcript_21947/g.60077  ORF Transcript_21947/g.60077 Transcript_21947/m.60077 type:complete len:82 (-) Transcript_21947:1436-1681(-)